MAKTPNKTASRVIFGNKEKKQFPDPEGLEREKPTSSIDIDSGRPTDPIGFGPRLRGKFSEQAPPMPGARETLGSRLKRVGKVRGGVSVAAPRKEEVDGDMENKTFTQFVTEAKRGRPRKLRPGEKADTEHLQDQLSKLTHANHVVVHFANGEKHEIPRGHANKALQKLASLKPEHRAAHVEHMHSSHENFYKTLAGHPIPSKKKTITLAGPKIRKEEVELEESLKDARKHRAAAEKVGSKHPEFKKHMAAFHNAMAAHTKGGLDGGKLSDEHKSSAKLYAKEEAEQIDELSIYKMQAISKEASRRNKDYSDPKGIKHQVYGTEVADDKIVKRAGKYDPSTATKVKDWVAGKLKAKKLAKEEHEDDGWYAHKEMHGSKAISKEDWKKGVRPGKSVKKEETYVPYEELDETKGEWSKKMDKTRKYVAQKLTDKAKAARDAAAEKIEETKAIKGTHATKAHAAPSLTPSKIGYAGKGTKPKAQQITREDYAPLEKGETQSHPDQKTVDAASRKQGADKPKKPKVQLTREEWELYDMLSDAHKTIFEKMAQSERDRLVDKYIKSGGKVKRGEYNKPRESEKPFPASKMKGSKWASTAGSINRKNQGFKK